LTDDDRRRLAVRAFRVGRRTVREIATIVTPDHFWAMSYRCHRTRRSAQLAAFVGVLDWVGLLTYYDRAA